MLSGVIVSILSDFWLWLEDMRRWGKFVGDKRVEMVVGGILLEVVEGNNGV